MNDATAGALENPGKKLETGVIAEANKTYALSLAAIFDRAGRPEGKEVFEGGLGDDKIEICEVRDKSSWVITVGRSIPETVTLRAQHSSQILPSAFIEESLKMDSAPLTPSVEYKETTISDPLYGVEAPTNLDNSSATLHRADKLVARIGYLINPKLSSTIG